MSAVAGAPPIAPGMGAHPPSSVQEKEGMSQGTEGPLLVPGRLARRDRAVRDPVRRHRAQGPGRRQQRLLPDRRVQTRHLVQARPDRIQQGRAVPADHGRHHDRGDVLHLQAPAAASRSPAGRGRDVLQLHPRHVQRKPQRGHGTQILPADRHDLRVHPRDQPDRLHPTAGQLGRVVQAVRREFPVVSDLRGRHERRLPADPLARRVLPVHLRGGQAPRPDRIPQKPDARRRQRPDRAPDLPDRDPLQLPAPDLADGAAVGEPARRSHADRVHGRRARACSSGCSSCPGSCCRRESRSSSSRPS